MCSIPSILDLFVILYEKNMLIPPHDFLHLVLVQSWMLFLTSPIPSGSLLLVQSWMLFLTSPIPSGSLLYLIQVLLNTNLLVCEILSDHPVWSSCWYQNSHSLSLHWGVFSCLVFVECSFPPLEYQHLYSSASNDAYSITAIQIFHLYLLTEFKMPYKVKYFLQWMQLLESFQMRLWNLSHARHCPRLFSEIISHKLCSISLS
jgi:hypothetical protein